MAPARLGGDQHQHLVDQVAEAFDGADGLPDAGFAFVGVGLALKELKLGADAGQRGAQLVGGVGDEALLGGGGLFEAVEHLVEFGDQRADFERRSQRVEGLEGAVFHAVQGAPDAFDRKQGMAHAEPDGEAGGAGEKE